MLISNAVRNLSEQKIATGFDFLFAEAAFDIGESFIQYSSTSNFLNAIMVGLLNTLTVAVIGNILAIGLGTLIGVARVSQNWLVRKISLTYIESFRNVPLLLQLFFWYVLLSEFLPSVREANPVLGSVFLTQRGLYFPFPVHVLEPVLMGLSLLASVWLMVRIWKQNAKWSAKPLYIFFGVDCSCFSIWAF